MRSLWTLIAVATLTTQVTAQDLAQWRYYKTLNLNTAATGANVAADVQNFPVAVALNEKNFDFSQAKPDGADLRFSTNQNGQLLQYSIEHWDSGAKSALVWVKVPKVRSNTADQSIVMSWGNPAATSVADSKAVFDTKDGFVGVWHLDEDGNTQDNGYKDATANDAHGTGVNLAPGSRVDAAIGKGNALKHAETQWIKVAGDKRKLFDLTDKLTFSIWAKASSFANKGNEAKRALPGYETMFAKGDNSWRLQKFGIKSWHKPPAELLEICVERAPKGDLCVVGKTDMALDRWYHFVGVHDHPQVKFYVDGVLDKVETFDSPWTSGDHPVGIGNQSQFPQQGRNWDGVLDEARVINLPKDENWIKLDYESQREGQKFLTFGKTQERRS